MEQVAHAARPVDATTKAEPRRRLASTIRQHIQELFGLLGQLAIETSPEHAPSMIGEEENERERRDILVALLGLARSLDRDVDDLENEEDEAPQSGAQAVASKPKMPPRNIEAGQDCSNTVYYINRAQARAERLAGFALALLTDPDPSHSLHDLDTLGIHAAEVLANLAAARVECELYERLVSKEVAS